MMKQKAAGAVLLTLTLIAGFEAGLVVERGLFSTRNEVVDARRPRLNDRRGGLARGPVQFASRLSVRLDLSVEQESAVEALLAESNAEVATLLGELKPEITAEVDSLTEAIRALLDSEQQAMFETMLRDDNDRFRRRIESGLVGRGPTERPVS